MGLRAFQLPGDIALLIEVLPPSFQYPENPEWSLQADELESFVDSLKGIRQVWPLIRVAQTLYAPLRDALRGYIWEEEGRAVGVSNVLRMGATDQWLIGNVSVLPEFRRRGIARQLVAASVDYARGRGARRILLDVVQGNLPAYTLYQTLGFEDFAGRVNLLHEGGAATSPIPLPAAYTLEPSPLFDWQPRYALAQRITPEGVRRYQPVEEGRFRQPAIFRPLAPVIQRAMGARMQGYLVSQASDGQGIGSGMARWRTRPGGTNSISLTLDPAHGAIAPALVTFLLHQVLTNAPGRRVEMEIEGWMPQVVRAAQAAGFRERCRYVSMGLIVG